LLRQLPLCASTRAPTAQRKPGYRIPARRLAPRCLAGRSKHEPWKRRWAGAATPTQQSTTRPQEPPRRA